MSLLFTANAAMCTLPDDYQGDWKASGLESGTKFTSIDLTEGEWFEYDEKSSEEVSIKDIKFDIKRA